MKYKVNILRRKNGLWFDNKNAKNVTYKDWKCPDLNVFFSGRFVKKRNKSEQDLTKYVSDNVYA